MGKKVNRLDFLVATSFKLACEKGFDNMSIKDITFDMNSSPGAVYYHFDTKDKLLKAIFKKYVLEFFKDFTNKIINNKWDFDYKLRFMFNYLVNYDITTGSPVIKDCPDFRDYYLFIISCFHMHSNIKKYVNEIAVELENSLKKSFQTKKTRMRILR
ncbi:MAG: TetR/AcrR family transcriptional regulator [Methanobrevibacter sp.]|uniref:TetR/AcrR family transcriptional regulator n=1 Tax=Methanobrevibacter sp. TaxID=66852 RepID=UPI002B21BCF8|nr:TetR/AcrR family transcriptional regulator [Methanobrevibacter sp.]MEA4957121.1 TetR/AcrR family transcriptional regulator [Methanobrevibacter sp.]